MKLVQTSVSSRFDCNSDLVQVAIKTKTSGGKKTGHLLKFNATEM